MVDGEALQIGIGRAFVEAVDADRVVAGANACPANIKIHFSGAEKLMKKFLASTRVETIEGVAGGIGHRRAKTKDGLKFFVGIESDGIGRRADRGRLPGNRRALG